MTERQGGDRTMESGGWREFRPPDEELPRPQPGPPGGTGPGEGVWRFTTAAVDASVPQARHAVRELLAAQGLRLGRELLGGLLVIVSELVTNAVRHAALLSPTIAVEVGIGAEWVRVSVADGHPYRPTALVEDHGRTGGRGLLLVREITREAGGVCDSEPTPNGGKIIWAALPLPPEARIAAHPAAAGAAGTGDPRPVGAPARPQPAGPGSAVPVQDGPGGPYPAPLTNPPRGRSAH